MGITIKDVARVAGVAVSTASRAMNDSGPVSAKTRHRVLAAARKLRYIPNGTARNLINKKAHTFGVFLPHLYGEFYSEVLRGMDDAAHRAGYQLLVSSSHSEHNDLETALRAFRGRVDGMIFMSPFISGNTLNDWLPRNVPVVLLHSNVTTSPFDTINVDNYGGACAMVQHLIDLGHERIAILKGPHNNFDAQERLRGYYDTLCNNGIQLDEELVLEGDFMEGSGYAAAHDLLRLDPRPTALFSFNDSMMIGALGVFQTAGLRIPEDLAVASFDDIPSVKYMHPPLTTVHLPIYELGSKAVDRLLHAITHENKHRKTHECLPTEVVVRRSCGASVSAYAS